MTNLEKIREAWRIGWAAEIFFNRYFWVIVSCLNDLVLGRNSKGAITNLKYFVEAFDFKIIDYKYAGQLAGNEEPREGQKFKIRKTGNIYTYSRMYYFSGYGLERKEHHAETDCFLANEIEPYFT